MSNIKINDVPQRIQYSATGGQTQFTIPFPFFSNSYVYVWLNGIQIFQGGAPGQYVVTGAGSPSGGLVTFNTAATLNDIVTIEGIMPIDRTSIYSATISNLSGSDLNGDFNREVVMLQQLNTTQSFMQLQYPPWVEISQDLTVTKDRYIPLLPPLGAWRMNEAGTEIETFLTPSSGGLAPADATYILQVADSDLPNAQAMGSLASGLVFNTTTTGVQLTRLLEAITNQLVITNPSGLGGNPTYGFADNAIFPGSEGLGIIEGTTAERPLSPVSTNFRFNTDLIILEYWDGSSWVQLSETDGVVSAQGTLNQILINGVTTVVDGAIVLTLSPTLDLPGTFTIQASTVVDEIINDDSMVTATATNLATALSIKNYIDSVSAGFTLINPVRVASTGNLVATYSNGASGVGATLTVTALGVASIDGVALSLNDRVLFKDQSTTFQNGIYYVSDVGSGGTSAVYTRATDFDQPSEIDPGDLVPVLAGTVNGTTMWLQTATVAAIGTDPITFVQFGAAFSNVVTLTGTQTITGDKTFTGLTTIDNFIFDANQMQHLADTNNYFEFGTDTQNFVTGGSSRMDISNSGLRLGAANSRVTTILDEDNMVSNSATALATQQSIKAYVDANTLGRLRSFQIFTSGTAQTYTRPAGITSILVEVVGGGGGGGGVAATGSGTAFAGGGGAGGYARLWVASASASYTYTVGSGGAGGTAGANNGTTGGTTTFSASSLQATGGTGGQGVSASTGAQITNGGTGGIGTNGNINSSGGCGIFGVGFAASAAGYSGSGGDTIYGGGAQGTQSAAAGANAGNYGSGGAGAGTGTVTNRAGGNGSAGLIVVWEFS
jgi:hypothetical protein